MTQRNHLPVDNMDNDQDSFVNFYQRCNAEKRNKLLGILSEQDKLSLYQLYLVEWDQEITRLQNQGNVGADVARELYAEVVTLQHGLYSGKRFNDFTEAHLFNVIHSSVALLREVQQNNTFSPDFESKLIDYNKVREDLHKQSKMSRTMGAMNALGAALGLACIIAVSVMTFFTYGATLTLIPLCLGLGIVGSLSAISPCLAAHSFLTKAKREKGLENKMMQFQSGLHPNALTATAEPEVEASAPLLK